MLLCIKEDLKMFSSICLSKICHEIKDFESWRFWKNLNWKATQRSFHSYINTAPGASFQLNTAKRVYILWRRWGTKITLL